MKSTGVKALPLEQCFQEAESSGCIDLLSSLDFMASQSGSPVSHNPLHTCVALWQSQFHGPVLTTNFDLLHEQAYYGATGKPIKRCFDGSTAPDISKVIGTAHKGTLIEVLIKLHGSIDSASSLKATLWRVGKGLDPALYDLLEFIRQNYNLCILGYSGSDPDIGPVLLKRSKYKIVWLMLPDSKSKRGFSELGGFGEQILSACDGLAIVADLCDFFDLTADMLLSSKPLSEQIRKLPKPITSTILEPAMRSWADKQSPAIRLSAASRIFLAALDTEHSQQVLDSVNLQIQISECEKIQIAWLKANCAALAHKYKMAKGLFRKCMAMAEGNRDIIAEISCKREIAHQDLMLGHPIRALRGMKHVEQQCRSRLTAPLSPALGFSAKQLLVETVINSSEIELSLIKMLPLHLRKIFIPAIFRRIEDSLTIQRELGIPDIRANLLRRRGLAYQLVKQYDKAKADFDDALFIFQNLGRTKTGVVNVLGGLADLYWEWLDFDKAKETSLMAIRIATGEGGRAGLAKHYRRLVKIEILSGKNLEAQKQLINMKHAGQGIEGWMNRMRFIGPTWLIMLAFKISIFKIKGRRFIRKRHP